MKKDTTPEHSIAIDNDVGRIYVGTMASIRHYVQHPLETQALTCIHGIGSAKVVALLRSNVFSHSHARARPNPEVTFQIANRVVADLLLQWPLSMPSLSECHHT